MLVDGSLDVDNNANEREIKAFIIDGESFVFENTDKGSTYTANIYSIIETTKA